MKRDLKALIGQMTLEEKASLCSGSDFWHTQGIERLGIPAVMVTDGPHGLRKQAGEADHLGLNDSVEAVCFPAGCATGSSFDPDLLEHMGQVLGDECQAEDVSILLGPAVNIKRSPLCGRNFEYISEDPYLAGKLSAAYIRGVQSRGVGTSIKHFAANNQETRRLTISSDLSERALHEIYLPAFEEAVKAAQPKTVMCSYNKINGVYASENKMLLTDILRDQWGFEGYVVSDWGAANDRVKGLEAGLDLEMPSSNGYNDAKIVAAVQNGSLDEAVLDRAVERILKVVFSYVDARRPDTVFDRAKDHAEAVAVETQCAVLLTNQGVLPLGTDQKIAYIGEFAAAPRYQGGGSSHIHPSRVTSAWEVAQQKGRNVCYAKGFSAMRDEMTDAELAEAIQAAQNADVAVVFAGLPESFESEGYDRTSMELPACQNRLIDEIAKVQPHVVVVLHNGSAVELPWADRVSAILELYLGGEGVGEAGGVVEVPERGDAGPAEIRVDQHDRLSGLGEDDCQVAGGGRLTVAGLGARHHDRLGRLVDVGVARRCWCTAGSCAARGWPRRGAGGCSRPRCRARGGAVRCPSPVRGSPAGCRPPIAPSARRRPPACGSCGPERYGSRRSPPPAAGR